MTSNHLTSINSMSASSKCTHLCRACNAASERIPIGLVMFTPTACHKFR